MVTLIGGVFTYTVWASMQLGSVQEQVKTSSKTLDEIKAATEKMAEQNKTDRLSTSPRLIPSCTSVWRVLKRRWLLLRGRN
jgi:hypothetical protein